MAGTPLVDLVQHDFSLIPLLNLVAEPIAGSATPSAANVGKLYRNTTTGRLEYVRNATTVSSFPYAGSIVDGDIAAGAAIALNKLATDPLARANHTGTQVAATISDLASVVQGYRLDQFAAPTANVSMNNQRLINVADPTGAADAATMQWVQNLVTSSINGHDWKDGAKVAVSTNVNLAAPGATLDGVAMTAGDRVVLYGQTTATENGIYVWNGAAAAMTRSTDAASSANVTSGMTIPIEQGTGLGMAILTTPDPITLGTTGLTFTILKNAGAYAAGTGLTLTGNTFALATPVSVANGGTGGGTALAARGQLNTPQRGAAATLGAIAAGGTTSFVHNLGTTDVNIQVYRVSDGATVSIGVTRSDANTAVIAADVAVSASTLRVVVTPIS